MDGSNVVGLAGLKRLARIVRRYYEEHHYCGSDLAGCCFRASRQLFKLAEDCGIRTEIGLGECHAFVLYGGKVVDVTATQFGNYQKVMVVDLETMSKRRSWSTHPWRLQHRLSNLSKANRMWGGHCDARYRAERQEIREMAKKAGLLK